MQRQTVDVVVVGAGIIGTCAAYYLAKQGAKVAILDRHDIAAGTSGACDRAVMVQSKQPGPMLDLALAGTRVYATLSDELGEDVEYDACGGMIVIETASEFATMRDIVARQQAAGVDVHMLTTEEAIIRQPAVSPQIVGATYRAGDGEVNPLAVCFAMARAARRYGAKLLVHTEVRGFLREGAHVVGVRTSAGDLHAAKTLIAAGIWSATLGRLLDLDLPITPSKGHILVTERLPKLIYGEVLSASYIMAKHHLRTEHERLPLAELGIGLVLGQTRSGNLLIGGSREFAGDDPRLNPTAIRGIAKMAVRLFPVLREVSLIRTYTGLRPSTPDGKPMLGAVDSHPGLYVAAGHGGDGIALGPITGKLMAAVILGTSPEWDLSPFAFNRMRQPNSVVQ